MYKNPKFCFKEISVRDTHPGLISKVNLKQLGSIKLVMISEVSNTLEKVGQYYGGLMNMTNAFYHSGKAKRVTVR